MYKKEFDLINNFCEGVKTTKEYNVETEFFKVLDLCISEFTIDLNPGPERIYRGRKKFSNQTSPLALSDYGPNPNYNAGRANHAGSRTLYLAGNHDTVIEELDLKPRDVVNIGIFKIINSIKILKLSNTDQGPYNANNEYNLGYFAIYLSRRLCEPKEIYGNTYAPMQFISKYCIQKNIAGIMYPSSKMQHDYLKRTNNFNYAIFGNFIPYLECIKSKSYIIDDNKNLINFEFDSV